MSPAASPAPAGSVIPPAIHVLARSSAGAFHALEAELPSAVPLCHWESMPPRHRVAQGDLLIVDLDDLPPGMGPGTLWRDGRAGVYLWLVTGDRPVAAGWLRLVYGGAAAVLHCPQMARLGGYAPLVAEVQVLLGEHGPLELARDVVRRAPILRRVEHLVEAVCRCPWEVRRPRDLARAVGVDPSQLRQLCRRVGFARIEHLIVFVRAAMLEVLGRRSRVSRRLARHLAGVADPSNLRRQLSRARSGSVEAFASLREQVLVISLVCTAGLVAACRERATTVAAQAATSADAHGDTAVALPVVGALVRRGDLVLPVRATGRVRAERQVALKAESQGTVAEVLVRPGRLVEAGQVLVRLDPRPFDLAVQEAEAAVGDARIRLMDLLLGDNPNDTSEFAARRRENTRLRSGIIGAEARLERARLERELATIVAPFGGTVDQVHVVVGERVTVGYLVAVLADLGSLYVEAAVLEHDLPLIRVGATATLSPASAAGRTYRGTVSAVLPLVDTTTRAGRALVTVRAPDASLRPGMYTDVELEATRLPGRVLVPAAAVIERDGRPLVFRARAGRSEWVYITPGRSNGTDTEVAPDSTTGRTPVSPGDTVLVAGHLTLTHDAPVRLQLGARRGPR